MRFFAEAITHWAAPNGVAPARDTEPVDNAAFMQEHLRLAHEAIARGDAPPTAASSLYNTDHALGDADTAIAYVERLRAAGVDNVMCLIQMGTLAQDEMLESIRIFGEQVIPHFRALDAAAERVGAQARLNGQVGERALVDLEHRRHRQLGDDLQPVGRLVVGEALAHEAPQVLERRRIRGIGGLDERDADLADGRGRASRRSRPAPTFGWSASTRSTSSGCTLKPPRMYISLVRPAQHEVAVGDRAGRGRWW